MDTVATKIIFLILGLLCLLFLTSRAALCAEINHVELEHAHNHYRLKITASVSANADSVRRIITDYENLTAINPYLKQSKIMDKSEDGRTTVDMLSQICIFIFCYDIRHVQIFHPNNTDTIYARIIPRLSDFQSGWLRWQIKAKDSDENSPVTEISFDTELTPDFFVAPVIGPYQIKRKMFEVASITINNLEAKAGLEAGQ